MPFWENMKNAAKVAGCSYRQFSQAEVLESMGTHRSAVDLDGLCFGLSTLWLESQRRGTSRNFFDRVRVWDRRPELRRANDISNQQRQAGVVENATGLRQSIDPDGDQKLRSFKIVGQDSEAQDFADWMASSNRRRYFMVTVPRHEMSAAGGRFGTLEFFDSNGGVVSTRSPRVMGNFLQTYFYDPAVRDAYKTTLGFVELDVRKFKE